MAAPKENDVFAGIRAGSSAAVGRGLRHFTLTEDHVKLLQAANVTWSSVEYGAPGIDPKRPYGNSSGIEVDIALRLGWEVFEDEEQEPHLTREQHDRAVLLHEQTKDALQVILATSDFVLGEYTADAYDTNWRLVRSAPGER